VPSSVPSRLLFGVALISGSLLMTELSLTRIFSVTMYYHFAFMAISIALFGLSASGVYVFLMRDRWRAAPTERLLAGHAFAFTLGTAVALFVLVRLKVGLSYTPSNIALMSAVYVLSAVPFFAGGAAISIAIARLSANINAVYAADLLGAGAGCLLLMPALNVLGAPGAIVAAAVLGSVAAVLLGGPAIPARWLRPMFGVIAVILATAASGRFDVSTTKGHENHPVLFSKWNSFSRIGVYDQPYGAWSLSDRYTGPLPDTRLMDIDSAAGTQILKFGGDLKDVAYLQYELTALGYRLFGAPGVTPATPFNALVIGTGGGRDLLSALVFGAARVDGVEINPIIVNDVMRGRFKDYSGGVYDRPNVHVAVEDGRSFVRRSPARYDIIQASLVDTWAATAAGAYALSENSLYTVEAFDDYLDHLADGGVLSISRWVFDGLRLISLAQEAGARRGWNPADRLAIVQHDRVATFLLKKTPFTSGERKILLDTAAQLGFAVLYMPGTPAQSFGDSRDDYARLMHAPDRQAFYAQYPLDVTPTTDDRPFFFHTTRLRNHSFVAPLARLFGVRVERPVNPDAWATGGLTALLVLLAISSFLIVLFILGPLALTSRGALGRGWLRSLAYFACLGGAFMLIEVALLQRFVLLLGHPVYSLTVTLFSLLLGTGLGSVLSRRIGDGRVRRAAIIACCAVACVGLLWGSVLPAIVQAAIAWPLALRLALAVALMTPAGMVMGIPLPAGVRLLAATEPQLVAWAWGINGALSVLGAILAVFIAMNWGFSVTLLCGAVVYAVAALLILSSPPMYGRSA
jgi:spermine/spermidine synthase